MLYFPLLTGLLKELLILGVILILIYWAILAIRGMRRLLISIPLKTSKEIAIKKLRRKLYPEERWLSFLKK